MTNGKRLEHPRLSLPVTAILLTAALLLLPATLTAESQTSVKLNAYTAVTSDSAGDYDLYGITTGRLTVKSVKNRDVKGEFSLTALTGTMGIQGPLAMDIYRAYIQMDFPYFRATAGKARLSWGDGIYFNAGDRLYGSTSLTAGLSSSVFRDDAEWLLGVYLPFGNFSFIEAVAMPPDFTAPPIYSEPFSDALTEDPLTNAGLLPYLTAATPATDVYDLEKTDAGARLVTEALNTKFEFGYLRDGETGYHEPYISLQGYLLLDWHAAVATTIDQDDWEETARENMEISAGLSHAFYFPSGPTLGFRVEGLIRPYAEWEETPFGDDTMEPEIAAAYALITDPVYALFLYPEISLAGNSASAVLNGLYSVVDNSALISLMGRWKIYQGLSLFGALSAQAGEETDLFGWARAGDQVLTIGAEYVY